ncbi:MAG: hypothetical protein ACOY93_19800 [Bacillota bacterium]
MITLLKAATQLLYTLLADASEYDQTRKEQALKIQHTTLMAA